MIWNPWAEFAKEIPDFGDDEFPNMVCVEAGRVAAPIVLLPGTAFEASQILQVWREIGLASLSLPLFCYQKYLKDVLDCIVVMEDNCPTCRS